MAFIRYSEFLKSHIFKMVMLYFTPLSNQHNGSVSSMSDCDLLAVIPAGSKPLAAATSLKSIYYDIRANDVFT